MDTAGEQQIYIFEYDNFFLFQNLAPTLPTMQFCIAGNVEARLTCCSTF